MIIYTIFFFLPVKYLNGGSAEMINRNILHLLHEALSLNVL